MMNVDLGKRIRDTILMKSVNIFEEIVMITNQKQLDINPNSIPTTITSTIQIHGEITTNRTIEITLTLIAIGAESTLEVGSVLIDTPYLFPIISIKHIIHIYVKTGEISSCRSRDIEPY